MPSRLALIVLMLLTPAIALAGVRAEVSATVGDDGVSQVRSKVLASALAEALKIVVARHLPSEELSPRRKALSSIYNKAPQYIRRYTIEAEGQRLDRYRLSVEAEVDQKRLLSKLEELGFEPRVLGAKPRVLVSYHGDPDSAALAAIVTGLFTKEEFSPLQLESAQVEEGAAFTGEDKELSLEVEQAQLDTLAKAAFDGSRHIACGVLLAVKDDGEDDDAEEAEQAVEEPEEALLPTEELADDEDETSVEEELPPEEEVELQAGGYIVDGVSGLLLGKHLASATGRGPDLEAATQDALKKLGSQLYQGFVADLTHARWALPGEVEAFEVRVEGVTSPSMIEEVAGALETLTELEGLSLSTIEKQAVVWRASGTDPGFGWEQIASFAKMPENFLGWRTVVSPSAPQGGIAVQDRQAGGTTQTPLQNPPKVLLGRFDNP